MTTAYEFRIVSCEAGDEFHDTYPYAAALNAQLMRIALNHGVGGYSKTVVELRVDGDLLLRHRVDVHNPADVRFYSPADVDFIEQTRMVLRYYEEQVAKPNNPYKITAEDVASLKAAVAACEDSNQQEKTRLARAEAAASGPWDWPCD